MNLMNQRPGYAAVALVLAVSLPIVSCGTRLDRDTIVGAGYSAVAPSEQGADGQALGPDVQALEPNDQVLGNDGESISPGTGHGSAGSDNGATSGYGDAGASAGSMPEGSEESAGNRPGAQGSGSGGPIVIGSVGHYSGPIGAGFVPGVRALQAWASEINAKGGINGRPVKVLVFDDGGNGAKARSQVRKLVEEHKAVAVVASMSFLTIAQWHGYVEQKKIPVIGGDCIQDLWNTSQVLFNQCPAVDTMAWSIPAAGAKYGKGKKWGVLYCAEAAACSRAHQRWFDDGWGKKAGMDPIYSARISIGQADYTAECVSARNAGAEVMTVLGSPDILGRVAASCNRQNYHPQFLQGGSTVGLDTPTKPGLSDVLAPMPTLPFAGLNTPAAQQFRAAWQRYAGETQMTGASSLGWTAAKLFEKAAKSAGPHVTPAGLIKALHSISNDRLGGAAVPLTYPAGKPTPDFKCWMVMVAENGKWTAPEGDKLSCR